MKYSQDNINKVKEIYISISSNIDKCLCSEKLYEEEHVLFIKSDEERELLNKSIFTRYKKIYEEFSNKLNNGAVFIPVAGNNLDRSFNKDIYLFVDEANNIIYNRVG